MGRGRGLGAKQVALAKELGENALLLATRYWIDCLRGLVPGANAADRNRAAENLHDRFGQPRMTEQKMQGDFPVKLYDLRGWEPAGLPPDPPAAEHEGNGAEPEHMQ
jgi:hypothetical protein